MQSNQPKMPEFSFRHAGSTDEGSPVLAPKTFTTKEMLLFKGKAKELKPTPFRLHSAKKMVIPCPSSELGEDLNQNVKVSRKNRSDVQ